MNDTPQLGQSWNKENQGGANRRYAPPDSSLKKALFEFSAGEKQGRTGETDRYMNNQFSFCESQQDTPRVPLEERIQN